LRGSSVDGSIAWVTAIDAGLVPRANPPLFGVIDDTGTPKLVVNLGPKVAIVDPNSGAAIREVVTGAVGKAGGGQTLADLDADGVLEYLDWSFDGLVIADLRDGSVLASHGDHGTASTWSYPVVGDVDGDGAAEVLVGGMPSDELGGDVDNYHLLVFGPAEGRWARTRPVWNQPSYEPSTIRDDGTIVRFPPATGVDYPMFRAQPAHDGDLADLVPVVLGVCADDCAEGSVFIDVAVENLGSKAAEAGASVFVSTWEEGGVLTEQARVTISEEVPSMMRSASVRLTVPAGTWGTARAVQVEGIGQECDHVNDQIDLWIDPCGS
jgi:hypothetical protein